MAMSIGARMGEGLSPHSGGVKGRSPQIMANSNSRNGTAVHQIQPLEDPRWGEFLERHPRSSVFHTVPWLEALRGTYGYQPTVITTSPPGLALQDGLVCCRVDSWLTGHRLVSLPFSDHCEPLVDDASDLGAFLCALEQELRREKLRYIELRPVGALDGTPSRFHPNQVYCLHHIDLTPDLDTLFGNCHKDSTQRKIRRAEREGLIYEEGRSELLLDAFYRLLVLTRRRHQVPPQPKRWFKNLIGCFGESLKIRVAFKDQQPVAAILTLRHKDTLVYKYGCSDAQFNNVGGMHLLFWRSIQEAKGAGVRIFDLGRSDCDNAGLITFKDRWGSIRSELTYSRCSASLDSQEMLKNKYTDWRERIAKSVFAHLPDRVLCSVGDLLYKHVG
jgi:CelD/BcsL family acetyltransferase involved in cellulose biosynthesis